MYRVNYTAEYFKNKNDILFHNDDTVYFILKKIFETIIFSS